MFKCMGENNNNKKQENEKPRKRPKVTLPKTLILKVGKLSQWLREIKIMNNVNKQITRDGSAVVLTSIVKCRK